MQKKVLTEQSLFYGDIDMPKGFEIDQEKLTNDILQSTFNTKEFPFSRTWDMLNTYMRDFIGLDYGINLINKSTWGNIYKPNETTIPLLNIGGVVITAKGEYPFKEIEDSNFIIKVLGVSKNINESIKIPKFLPEDNFIIWEKTKISPREYPRRDGMPKKKPIVK